VAPGDPYDNQGDQSKPPHAGATVSHPRQSTTHLVVSDSRGNVVSYTFTIESTGGNAIVVPGYGFLMNNELTDFNFDSQTHPNRSDGDKRPRSSMSPTIVTRCRLARRLDDPRHGAPDPARAARPGRDAAAGHRAPARHEPQHDLQHRGARLHQLV
jgi:hypothetical protein